MKINLPSCLVVCLCLCGSGCALLPVAALNLAAQGAQGVVALTLGPLSDLQERSGADRCAVYGNKGISVSESLEIRIPTSEGAVKTFEPASWRPEFTRDGYPEVERFRTPVEGRVAMSERSILLVPPPGAIMVRIPYELVQNVEIGKDAITGAPRSMIVKSCEGRFDIVTFWQLRPKDPDPDATAVAAAQLEARVAAFRAAAHD
jgi:hypothetical protein